MVSKALWWVASREGGLLSKTCFRFVPWCLLALIDPVIFNVITGRAPKSDLKFLRLARAFEVASKQSKQV